MATDLSLPIVSTQPALPGASAAAHPKSAAAEAARRFEGLMISTLLKQSLGGGPLGDGGVFGNGPGSDVYQGFLETYLADHLAKAGGLGLARTLERSLSGRART